jgi:ATP-dependent RNA helicase RhlE
MTKITQSEPRFSELGIRDKFLTVLTKKGFTTPTPIQHQVIPGALEGKDVIGIAQTGTGKTLAFGIPMIQNIALNKGQGLVVVPTRELALQVEEAIKQVGAPLGVRSTVIIGGVSQGRQVRALKTNPHIVIATPGRLEDLLNQKKLTLKNMSIIALDEADRMLDDGFLPAIKKILKQAPKERQTLLFSATMPSSIASLASEFMKIPLRIEIAPQGTSAENVEQEVFVVSREKKMQLLESLLREYKTSTTLIFSRTKHGAKKMARQIRDFGHTATEIHSNRTQSQRQIALKGFSTGKYRVMVATDIAARGIDVKDISLVINYDLPDNSEDYVHRIGRTGRAGRSGKAISFMTTSQKADVKKIERLIRKTLPILFHPSVPGEKEKYDRAPETSGGRSYRGRGSRSGGRSSRSSYSRSSDRRGGSSSSRSTSGRSSSSSRSTSSGDSRRSSNKRSEPRFAGGKKRRITF